MKMYRCPDCGRTSTSMYCDACGKTIPSQYVTYGAEAGTPSGMAEGTDATNILLEKISRAEERNNELLSAVQKNTKVVAVISIISVVAAVASALFTVLSLISFM